jgi:hypothetical protein
LTPRGALPEDAIVVRRVVPMVVGLASLAAGGCGRARFDPVPVDAATPGIDARGPTDAALDAATPGAALDAATPGIDGLGPTDAALDAGAQEDAPLLPPRPPDAFVAPDAGRLTIPEDCAHRWRRTTNLSILFKMHASDVGLVVAGFASGDMDGRTDGLDEATGVVGWTRTSVGGFGDGAADRYAVFQNTNVGDHLYGVIDMHTGADVATFQWSYVTIGFGPYRLGVRDDGESLVAAYMELSTEWGMDVTGAGRLMGPAPATLLVRHGADGSYRGHAQVASAALTLEPQRVGASGWGIVVSGQSVPVTFGSHVVAPGMHELVVLDDDLGFARTHAFSDRVEGVATLPGAGLLAVLTSSRLVGLDSAGEIWSRPDCQASLLDASRTRVFVGATLMAGTSTFCGATSASALGARVMIVELDPRTGATLDARWFGVSSGEVRRLSVAGDGDAYLALTGDATVCGETGTGTSSEHFLIAL